MLPSLVGVSAVAAGLPGFDDVLCGPECLDAGRNARVDGGLQQHGLGLFYRAAVDASASIVNGSFESGDYSGWTLQELPDDGGDAGDGTFANLASGTMVNDGDELLEHDVDSFYFDAAFDNFRLDNTADDPTEDTIPVPAPLALIGLGLIGLAGRRR